MTVVLQHRETGKLRGSSGMWRSVWTDDVTKVAVYADAATALAAVTEADRPKVSAVRIVQIILAEEPCEPS